MHCINPQDVIQGNAWPEIKGGDLAIAKSVGARPRTAAAELQIVPGRRVFPLRMDRWSFGLIWVKMDHAFNTSGETIRWKSANFET
jgi:hypothetical protein